MPSVGSSLALVCLDLLCPRFEVGDHLLQESISSVGCVSAVHHISSIGIGMPGREDHDPLHDGDDRRGGDRGNGGKNCLAVAEVHPGTGRPGGCAAQNAIRDDARLLDDVAPPLLPTAAIGRRPISNSRNPQAGELLPGGPLVVNLPDDPCWDHSRLFLWPIDATTWIVLTSDGVKYAERLADYSRARVLPHLGGGGETPEGALSNLIVIGLSS